MCKGPEEQEEQPPRSTGTGSSQSRGEQVSVAKMALQWQISIRPECRGILNRLSIANVHVSGIALTQV